MIKILIKKYAENMTTLTTPVTKWSDMLLIVVIGPIDHIHKDNQVIIIILDINHSP